MHIQIPCPDSVQAVLNALHKAGHEAYIVGGCVRDCLLDNQPKDWDVTTSAGRVEFIMNNPTSNIRTLEDGRVFMYDIDGNCFTIEDPKKLDKHSYKKVEIYL